VQGRAKVRTETLGARCRRAAEVLDGPGQAIAWCGLNHEADTMTALLDGAVNLTGSLPPERKVEIIEAFKAGDIRVLVTKPSIAGMGLNFQCANRQVFVGLGDSYESYYQAIRRSWRFGQTRPVDVHIVVSDLEAEIVANVRRKEQSADEMTERLVRALHHQREEAA
jgi:superfamily II DNA or RNA helicase